MFLRIGRNWLALVVSTGIVMSLADGLLGRQAIRAVLVVQLGGCLPVAVLAGVVVPRLSAGIWREVVFGAEALLITGLVAAKGWWAAPAYVNRCVVLMLPHPGRPEPPPVVTVSVGIATAVLGDTVEDLSSRADAALYGAKAAGRNGVQAAVMPI